MTRTSLSAATRAQRDESARNSSFQPQPLVYPEARRALIHPRNPFPATSHPLVLRTAEANEGPLATEVPSANADASSIGILSDQRESKGLELEFHLTVPSELMPLTPPRPRKPAAPPLNTYEPPSYQLPLAPHHPRKLFVDQSSKSNADRACPLPFAQTHPRKLFGVCLTPNKSASSARPLPLALIHPRKLFVDQSSTSNADRACPLPIAQITPAQAFRCLPHSKQKRVLGAPITACADPPAQLSERASAFGGKVKTFNLRFRD